MDAIKRLQASIDQTRPIVAATSEAQFDLPTPCTEWDVRSLINHTLGALAMFRDVGTRGEADMSVFAADLVGPDATASYDDLAATVLTAWAAPGRVEQPAKMPWAEMPSEIALQMLADDVLVHGWDLAKATGQQVSWDEALAEETLEFAQIFFTAEVKGDSFADPIPVSDDADAMTRLVAFLGRKP